jgi:hypothetical protein
VFQGFEEAADLAGVGGFFSFFGVAFSTTPRTTAGEILRRIKTAPHNLPFIARFLGGWAVPFWP